MNRRDFIQFRTYIDQAKKVYTYVDFNEDEYEGEYVKSIDLNRYNKGIYLLEIITNRGTINKKLILQ